MPAPDAVLQLVQRFTDQISSYHAAKYNETETRRELIDPFFSALGWDMDNKQHFAEAYKDIIHEDAIKVGGVTKAPDYAFRIGGTRKFFVEAKKPSVNVHDDITPAFQLRRYAWTAKLPLSILTDFEELAVYDCRQKPDKTDKASTGRIMYLNYKEYADHWDEIAGIFSKDAILKGSFDRYAEGTKGKRGTTDVDDAFLAEIEKWRDLLAHNIALRNPISQRELNYAVQMTVDRIIFLRICEDRGIEPYGRLQALVNGGEIYPRLVSLFRYADQRYNSGLFHFNPEKGQQDAPDGLTPSLQIDDKTLKEIIGGLYYPESPYEFSVLPANILGQVYEQFLGKVIRKTSDNRAVVEDKPEVKKAGGVYYTPTYIVDYIVKHTVGALLESKKPGDMGVGRGQALRVLDPACGSGSFLLGAYQYLLDWYRDGYVADGTGKWFKGKDPTLYQGKSGEWKLTTAERKRILLDHIYGVDIDSQAVEVTKLSLLLKVLEGESEQSLQTMLDFYKERVLPNLGQNIKCGNSLIGPDFYTQGTQLALFDEEEQYRINAFDWQREFGHVFMQSGGFDAVIGNPPYIRIQALKEWAPKEVEFYKKKYISASKGNYDIYVVFVEKGLSLLNARGHLGFILPHKFFNAQYGEPLRKIISDGKHLSSIVHFGDKQVFENATTYTCLMILEKQSKDHFVFEKVTDISFWKAEKKEIRGEISSVNATNSEWNFTVGENRGLFEKLSSIPYKLSDFVDIFVGIQTSADDVYILDFVGETENSICLKSRASRENWEFEKELFHPIVSGTDVSRYQTLQSRQYVLFPYSIQNNKATLIPFNTIQKNYPKTAKYILKNKKVLENREKGKIKGEFWYGYIYQKNMIRQFTQKLCVPRLVNFLYASFDENGDHFLDNVDVGGLSYKPGFEYNGFNYLLGLLNSKLLRWYFPLVSAPFRGGWFSANRQFLSQLPIIIKRNVETENPLFNNIEENVKLIRSLHKKLAIVLGPQQKDMLQRQIDATDHEIDRLVYELYGLIAEEIKIVEGEASTPLPAK